MTPFDTYLQAVQQQLAAIHAMQRPKVLQAAEWVAAALCGDRFIYTFGCGHSHALAEETFYRAGGLARVVPILDEKLMVHISAADSTQWERREGYAAEVLSRYPIAAGDILFVVSNSGRNAVPIEAALLSQQRGARVVAISSLQHSGNFASRHSSGKRLADVADLVIDNQSVPGDAAVVVPGVAQKMGPTSTITSAFLLHSIFMEAAARAAAQGKEVEVYPSINTDSGAVTETLTRKYRGIVRHL